MSRPPGIVTEEFFRMYVQAARNEITVSAISFRAAVQCLLKIGILVLFSLTASAETTLERIKRENLIKVGVANERPYGYVTAEGKLTGEGPEIARKILAKIDPDIQMEGVVTPFDLLIPNLYAKRLDIIAAGMFITPERCEVVAFSNPTYVVGQAFAVKAGNPKDLTDYKSVAENPNAKLGIMAGAIEYKQAYKAGIVDPDRIVVFLDPQAGLTALKAGEIDAFALTSLSIQNLIRQANDPSIEATPQFFPVIDGEPVKGYGAFAFRKKDQELLAAFNKHLATFIGSDEHLETAKEFGFTPNMVPDKTAKELCRLRRKVLSGHHFNSLSVSLFLDSACDQGMIGQTDPSEIPRSCCR